MAVQRLEWTQIGATKDDGVHDGLSTQGEITPFHELLLIAPWWGHVTWRSHRPGEAVADGALIGEVRQAANVYPIHAPVEGLLVDYLAREGDWVTPGRPLVRLEPLAPRED